MLRKLSAALDQLSWWLERGYKETPRNMLWRYQRATRGWSDADAWNIPFYLEGKIVEMFGHMEGKWVSYANDMTYEEYTHLCSFIYLGFKRMQWLNNTSTHWGDLTAEDREAIYDDAETARYLLAKYFYTLWD